MTEFMRPTNNIRPMETLNDSRENGIHYYLIAEKVEVIASSPSRPNKEGFRVIIYPTLEKEHAHIASQYPKNKTPVFGNLNDALAAGRISMKELDERIERGKTTRVDLMKFQFKDSADKHFGEGTYDRIMAEAGGTLEKLQELAESLGMSRGATRMSTDNQLVAWIENKKNNQEQISYSFVIEQDRIEENKIVLVIEGISKNEMDYLVKEIMKKLEIILLFGSKSDRTEAGYNSDGPERVFFYNLSDKVADLIRSKVN